MIKKFIQAAALLAACSGAAHASTFDFSYTFTDGQAVTGSFDGTQSGDLVTNISNVSAAFEGVAFSGGSLFIGSFDPSGNSGKGAFNYAANSAVVSTDAALNNFVINDSSDPLNDNSTNSFYLVNGTTPDFFGSHEANVSTNAGPSDYDNEQVNGVGQWSLTPVPLPAALPLVLSGLGLLAAAKRRRQAAAA